MKLKFMEALNNAALTANGWRWTAYLTSALAGVMTIAMVWVSTHQTTILLPYNLAAMQGPVKVSAAGTVQAAEYLGTIATSDLGLALTWTPDTVKTQYARLLNRMTPALYATQNVKLIGEADLAVKQSLTQAYFIDHVSAIGDNAVQVTGTLARWEGEKPTYRAEIAYLIKYESHNGYLHVDSITAK